MADTQITPKATFTAREKELSEKWSGTTNVEVNAQQKSFDTLERRTQFDQNLCLTEADKERHSWYRSEWYRRPNEFDPGPAPLAVTIELVSSCNLSCSMCYTITEEFQDSVVGVQRMLPWSVVTSIIDECAKLNVPSILFSWRGESSIYRVEMKRACFGIWGMYLSTPECRHFGNYLFDSWPASNGEINPENRRCRAVLD